MALCPAMKKARALKLIRRLKAAATEVSEWEGEFLESVETRLDTYGRAFADPEKGGRDSAVSVLQGRKLKEIKAKVSGEPQAAKPQAAKSKAAKPKAAKLKAAKPRAALVRRKPLGAARRPPPRDPDEDADA